MQRCKPSATFIEDELAMRLLVGGTVKPGGEGAIVVAIVQRRRWPMVVFPSLAAPLLDRLGFRDYRWGI